MCRLCFLYLKLYTNQVIYFIYGDDTNTALSKAKKVVETLQLKKPDSAYFKIEEFDWDSTKVDEWIGGMGLFASNYLVFVDRVFKNKEAKEYLVSKRKELADSPNFFVILEGKMDKVTAEKINKVAWKTEIYEKPEKTNLNKEEKLAKMGEKIDFFEYADAFGSGDKKYLWVLYREAVEKGVPAEELQSIFFWQAKVMLSAVLSGSPESAGLKPFPYQKGKLAGQKFGEAKLRKICGELVSSYHEAHRGKVDLYNALEKIILEM